MERLKVLEKTRTPCVEAKLETEAANRVDLIAVLHKTTE